MPRVLPISGRAMYKYYSLPSGRFIASGNNRRVYAIMAALYSDVFDTWIVLQVLLIESPLIFDCTGHTGRQPQCERKHEASLIITHGTFMLIFRELFKN